MTRHWNFSLKVLQRKWSFVEKLLDVQELRLQSIKMRRKLRLASSNGALSLRAMTWNYFQQRKLR
jgi:hypothetical protein